MPKKSLSFVAFVLSAACVIAAQSAPENLNPAASYVNVVARRAELAATKSARVQGAVKQLRSCTALKVVEPPQGPMQIPRHYLNGSHGAVNPAEHEATVPYALFEKRVAAGMNRFLVTGDHAEAQCAQEQIDLWAQSGTLLDYDLQKASQAWYQVEWTLGSIAASESVLVNDPKLDKSQVARDLAWMNKVAHQTISVPQAAKSRNNHYYWRGFAVMATGVVTRDRKLFDYGVQAYKDAVNEIDERGAFPREMQRSERSIHYQAFALQPLLAMAALAERQGLPLYEYKSAHGRTIADAVEFLGKAVADPSVVKPYTQDAQMTDFNSSDFVASLEFYTHHFPQRQIPASLAALLAKPVYASRLGGSTTVLAGR